MLISLFNTKQNLLKQRFDNITINDHLEGQKLTKKSSLLIKMIVSRQIGLKITSRQNQRKISYKKFDSVRNV